jgi:hypothetical protein
VKQQQSFSFQISKSTTSSSLLLSTLPSLSSLQYCVTRINVQNYVKAGFVHGCIFIIFIVHKVVWSRCYYRRLTRSLTHSLTHLFWSNSTITLHIKSKFFMAESRRSSVLSISNKSCRVFPFSFPSAITESVRTGIM